MTDMRFPNWQNLYKEQKREKMPWYNPNLDLDLENELTERKINIGNFLDLGTRKELKQQDYQR